MTREGELIILACGFGHRVMHTLRYFSSQHFLIFFLDLAVQISEETAADVIARNMRRHSAAGNRSVLGS